LLLARKAEGQLTFDGGGAFISKFMGLAFVQRGVPDDFGQHLFTGSGPVMESVGNVPTILHGRPPRRPTSGSATTGLMVGTGSPAQGR